MYVGVTHDLLASNLLPQKNNIRRQKIKEIKISVLDQKKGSHFCGFE